jgi:hypothetical protein
LLGAFGTFTLGFLYKLDSTDSYSFTTPTFK